MGKITAAASERVRIRQDLPPWFPLAQAAAGVVLAAGLAVAVLVGAAAGPTTDGPAASGGELFGALPDAPTVPAGQPAGPSTATRSDVTVAGGRIDIPVAAAAQADAGVAALHSGDFAAVHLPAGVDAPQLTTTWPDATISGVGVVLSTDGLLTYRYAVDRDGPGAGTPVSIEVTVRLEAGRWVLDLS